MDTLKTCPFCGKEPTKVPDFPVAELHTVSCENKDCKVHPHTVGMTMDEAIERWNTRNDIEN